MAEVFISYKSDRRPAAEYFAQVLERYGFSAWYDYGLLPGAQFEAQLTAKLDEASVVLVLWCSLAAESPWVAWEAERAGDKYLPVLIEAGAAPPARFQLGHYLDLSAWSGEPQSGRLNPLLLDLERRLGRKAAPDLGRLHDLHRLWEALGALPLSQIALRGAAPAATPAPAGPAAPRPRATMPPREPKVSVFEPLGLELVWVPPTTDLLGGDDGFWMGATRGHGPKDDPDAAEHEAPARRVKLTHGYWLGRHPVTNEQYARFVTAARHRPREPYDGKMRPRQPVTGVSWEDAMAYCRWVSGQLETGWSCALPTEAQWEWAARGAERRRYPWGDAAPTEERAVFGGAALADVGGRPAGAGPFGAEDQAGQVWEWCADAYGAYPALSTVDVDPCRQSSGAASRVVRGGSWGLGARDLRATYRSRDGPGVRGDDLGFRVCVFREPGGRS